MPPISMISVDSSNVKAIGYDTDTKTLRVQFHNGTAYRYREVPEQVFGALKLAESVGKAFNELVKKGGFTFEKEVEDVPA